MEFEDELEWKEYVKRVDRTVALEVILKVPGCNPSTDVAFVISGQYEGGVCDEESTDCVLNLPDSEISIVTEKPSFVVCSAATLSMSCHVMSSGISNLIVPEFNVIRGKWTKPVKLMIPDKLLQPEQLTVTPESLLKGALQFQASLISGQSGAIQFSYTHPYFPRRTYMYVKAKEDLALSQRLEIEFNMKCPECRFSQFPPKSEQSYPVFVAESSKQKFVPFYVPTMKIWHKYCFKLTLNQPPIAELGVTFELCGQMSAEPREVTFSKEAEDANASMSKPFCITPNEEAECKLKFFLTGPMVHQFVAPDPIEVFSREMEPMLFDFSAEITVTNRKLSAPQHFSFPTAKDQYLKATFTPYYPTDPGFFTFEPATLKIDTQMFPNERNLEFFVTPSVDCPMRETDSKGTLYYVIEWRINGSLGNYMKPHPIYIKVTENTEETESFQEWCPEEIDCTDPPTGQTCVMDECVLNPQSFDCTPILVEADVLEKQSGLTLTQKIMLGAVAAFVLINAMVFLGCCKKEEEEEEDTTDDIEVKKIFNTESNLKEAEVAMENLLWQLYKFEQNLDVNRKYYKDIHNEDYYDD